MSPGTEPARARRLSRRMMLGVLVVCVVLAVAFVVRRSVFGADAFVDAGIQDAGQNVDVGRPVTFGLLDLTNRTGEPVELVDAQLRADGGVDGGGLRVRRVAVEIGRGWAGVSLGPIADVVPRAVPVPGAVVPPSPDGELAGAVLLFEVENTKPGVSWRRQIEVRYRQGGRERRQVFEVGTIVCSTPREVGAADRSACMVDRKP